MHQGHRQQLVSDPVARAVLRLLRERTNAELFAIDIGVEGIWNNVTDGSGTNLLPVLRRIRRALHRRAHRPGGVGERAGRRVRCSSATPSRTPPSRRMR